MRIFRFIKRWVYEEEALAAVEAAMIFPIMCTLLLGIFDIGNGILANQKTIRASQVVADLVARSSTVSAGEINEAIEAGRLAFEPMDDSSYGIDIVSVKFDASENMQVVWRQTQNMSPISDITTRLSPLSAPNEGAVMVAVQYKFEPLFVGFVTQDINMQEVAFSRGRESAVVNLE